MTALAQASPALPVPEQLYMEFFESMPLSEWQMLTGLEESASAADLAQAYVEVVRKKLQKGIREGFSDWLTQSGVPVTEQQRQFAEQLLSQAAAVIEVVNVAEEGDDLLVTYHVIVDPEGVEEPSAQPSQVVPASPAMGLLVFVAGGIATSLLVKKGVGLKILAGVAGGSLCATAWGFMANPTAPWNQKEEMEA